MSVNLLTEHHLEFLSLIGDYRGLSESTLVKMPHCWKTRVTAQFYLLQNVQMANGVLIVKMTARVQPVYTVSA